MAQIKIGVLGSGVVGDTLSNGFLKHGYEVKRGSREPKKLADWQAKAGSKAHLGTFQEAAAFGNLVVLAVKGSAAEATLKLCGDAALKGKTVIDATNPIADAAPEHGVLRFFTDINRSLMESLQKQVPTAHFVKAFSCVGSHFMVNPNFAGGRPTMFICGDHDGAKKSVREVLTQFGWDTEDMGPAIAARAIEPLCMLYCIPGLAHQKWNHAFKLLRN